tara:strand:+ start:162 stop:362 length:201 start_codon:yes stop_codon:yes gene_type:complete
MAELLELLHATMTLTAVTLSVPAVILTGADVPDIAPLLETTYENEQRDQTSICTGTCGTPRGFDRG